MTKQLTWLEAGEGFRLDDVPEAGEGFRLDDVQKRAAASSIGKVLIARGFTVAHIGGGGLAWEKNDHAADRYVYITSGDADIGDDLTADQVETTPLCAGVFNGDADEIAFNNDLIGATAAADWCDRALAGPGR
jgi:hypothetical protein